MRPPRTVPVALLLTVPVLACLQLPKRWPGFPGGTPFGKAVLAYGLVALLSLAAMATVGERRWSDFGFQRATGPWPRLARYALVLGTLSGLAVKLSPGKGMDEAMKGVAPPFIPLLILVASVVEELAMRGWLQGFLEPLRGRVVNMGPVSVSVPVLTSSLTFGAWHLPVILFDPWTGCIVVVFTTLLGYLAATARERSSGLAPAVWTHIAGNVGGILAGILYTVVHMAMGGAPPTMP